MQVRKFFGASTREVLREVRDALGTNAIILSNRQVAGGIEIIATAEHEVQAHTHSKAAATPSQPARPAAPSTLISATPALPVAPGISAMPRIAPVQTPATKPASPQYAQLSEELKRMRSLLESQLSGFAWGNWRDATRSRPSSCAPCSVPASAPSSHAS